jgi:ribonuclease HIII
MKMDDLQRHYQSIREKLESNGYSVTSFQVIAYGIQFQIQRQDWSATMRVYQNANGRIKNDYSQLTKNSAAEKIISLIEASDPSGTEFKAELPLIGCDESGKGDYFGALVCAAVYVDETVEMKLRALGVRDSKNISDAQVLALEPEIAGLVSGRFCVFVLEPEEYNQAYEKFASRKQKLNTLLAWAHEKAIQCVLKHINAKRILIDRFAEENSIRENMESLSDRELLFYARAEQNIAVAAASIMARAAFLSSLGKLSKKYRMPFLKGASEAVVKQARQFVQANGTDSLKRVAKLHFRTTQQVRALELDL